MNIYDIAKKAGVSIATVSRVINGSRAVSEKTRSKVTAVMQELGYTPNVFARGLMVNSMKTIGIMTIDVRDLYFANAIHTIEQETHKLGYNLFLCSTGEDLNNKKKYLKLLLEKRVDGIILVGSVFKEREDNSHILEAAQQAPVVLINGYVQGENVYCITCDDAYGVSLAVNHLADGGFKEIVYLYNSYTFSGYEKIRGFKKAMQGRGLPCEDSSIIKVGHDLDGAYRAISRLMAGNRKFNAVITSEDILAVGVLKKLRDAGLAVPDDVAVTGINDSLFARCTDPELTSVDAKVESLASGAVKLLADALGQKNPPAHTTILPELVIRGSSRRKSS